MKRLLLLMMLSGAAAHGQSGTPTGRYVLQPLVSTASWKGGDLLLLEGERYELSNGESGTYRYSLTARRLFFTSGPLRSAVARTEEENGETVLLFPATENAALGGLRGRPRRGAETP